MACGRNAKGSMEEKAFGLISEYGALYFAQIQRYFAAEQEEIRNILRILRKKGRVFCLEKEGLVLAHKDIQADTSLIRCFWVLADLADTVEHHFRGAYPLQLMFYANAAVYEVFYCPIGEELALSHAIDHIREKNQAKTIIVVEDTVQIPKLDVEKAVFCTISADGEVNYYE